jgi:hypothetical protein
MESIRFVDRCTCANNTSVNLDVTLTTVSTTRLENGAFGSSAGTYWDMFFRNFNSDRDDSIAFLGDLLCLGIV